MCITLSFWQLWQVQAPRASAAQSCCDLGWCCKHLLKKLPQHASFHEEQTPSDLVEACRINDSMERLQCFHQMFFLNSRLHVPVGFSALRGAWAWFICPICTFGSRLWEHRFEQRECWEKDRTDSKPVWTQRWASEVMHASWRLLQTLKSKRLGFLEGLGEMRLQ